MAHTHDGQKAVRDPHFWERVQQVRRQMKASQRSAADSVEKSADSHDRAAKSYEKLAECSVRDEYLEHAARHRAFAQEDRRMAEQLRSMAVKGLHQGHPPIST
jgi:hypothetical protein